MQTVLQHVSKRAGFTLPPEAADKIIEDSGGNLRKAILVLEALKMQSYVHCPPAPTCISIYFSLYSPDLSGPLAIAKPDWETYCHKVADLIVTEQSPARVMDVRTKLYELLSHCIPPTVILKVQPFPHMQLHDSKYIQTIADRVVERVDESIKADVMHWAAVYVGTT